MTFKNAIKDWLEAVESPLKTSDSDYDYLNTERL